MDIQALPPTDRISDKICASEEIQDWIVSYLADLLEIEPEEVDVTIPFDRYGLDSSAAVGLTGELADWLGRSIEPTLLYDYPTVGSLVEYLATEVEQKADLELLFH